MQLAASGLDYKCTVAKIQRFAAVFLVSEVCIQQRWWIQVHVFKWKKQTTASCTSTTPSRPTLSMLQF